MFAIAPVGDGIEGRESHDDKLQFVLEGDVAASEANGGSTVSLAAGTELAGFATFSRKRENAQNPSGLPTTVV
jgi:hypothetical protein